MAETTTNESTSTSAAAEKLSALQSHLASLQSLQSSIHALRILPARLLQPPSAAGNTTPSKSTSNAMDLTDLTLMDPTPPSVSASIKDAFRQISGAREEAVSDSVQNALKAAKESEKKDGMEGVEGNRRRRRRKLIEDSSARKRRRLNSSTATTLSASISSSSDITGYFPENVDDTSSPLRLSELETYVREFNRRRKPPLSSSENIVESQANADTTKVVETETKDVEMEPGDSDVTNSDKPGDSTGPVSTLVVDTSPSLVDKPEAPELPDLPLFDNRCRLHIWRRHPSDTIPKTNNQPVTLRFTIPDVSTMYIVCTPFEDTGVLVPESATCFGPGEKKSPYGRSKFAVYQALSQQLAKMIQSQPTVSVQSLLHLLRSYTGLFVDPCTTCERVLSAEGHVPPVVRVWTESPAVGSNPSPENGKVRGRWEAKHVACRIE